MEEWKPIKGYEGLYEVSNLGRVKSLGKGKNRNSKGRILKAHKSSKDYLYARLCKEGKTKSYYVHRLVAIAFVDNPEGYNEVNHKDENKENNCADNLEWCNRQYNMTYNGRAKRVAEKLKKPIFSVDKESGLIMYWESTREAERCTGISNVSICNCLKGKRNSAGGFLWFYAE